MSEKLEKLRAMLEKEKERRIKLNNRIRLHSAGNVPIGWSASTVPGFFPACMVGLWQSAE